MHLINGYQLTVQEKRKEYLYYFILEICKLYILVLNSKSTTQRYKQFLKIKLSMFDDFLNKKLTHDTHTLQNVVILQATI